MSNTGGNGNGGLGGGGGGDFRRQAGEAARGVWDFIVKGKVPEQVKRALKPCERCGGSRAIAWRGHRMPCPVCCHEDGSMR